MLKQNLWRTHKMANTKITSRVIADNAVTTAAIADDAITSAKLDTNIAVAGTLTVTGDITGTLATAAQPNITSVGTLTGFTSTGIDDNADATAITIDSSENVGIGTSTIRLSEKLHVLGQGIVTSSAEDTNMGLFGTFGSSTQIIGSFNNIPVIFRQNNTEKMRIDSSGDIQIGGTTNNGRLSVYPSGTNDPALYAERSSTNVKLIPYLSSGAFSSLTQTGDSGLFYSSSLVIGKHASGNLGMRIDGSGNLTVGGSLSKGSGSFKIDHPLEAKTDTHHLVHSFVEAPQADNIYRGKVDLVDGSAI